MIIDGIPYDMKLLQGPPAAGLYYYKTKLPPGNHVYYFVGIDDCGTCVLHPHYGVLYGPRVGEVGNSTPRLIGEKVDPASGYPNTTFNYYIEYRDPDNDPPSRAEIYINGKPYEMQRVGGKPDCGIIAIGQNYTPAPITTTISTLRMERVVSAGILKLVIFTVR